MEHYVLGTKRNKEDEEEEAEKVGVGGGKGDHENFRFGKWSRAQRRSTYLKRTSPLTLNK